MRTLKRFLILVMLLAGCALSAYNAYAAPVKPGPITVPLPDGTTITIRGYGDEWASYVTTEDGYGIRMGEDGFPYYIDNQGNMLSVRAKNASARTAADRAAMRNASMGVPFNEIAQKRKAAMAGMAALGKPEFQAAPVVGTKNCLVLTIDFPNKSFTASESATHSYYNDFLNGANFTQGGATGSVQKYYTDNSSGQLTLQFALEGTYTAPNNINNYGGANGSNNVPSLIRNVIDQMISEGFNFAPYVTSGSNSIDGIFIIFAGNDCAAAGGYGNDKIWPHQWYIGIGVSGNGYYTAGGYRFGSYACGTELGGSGTTRNGIGTVCHEFGHVLGLMDYYDTANSGSVTPNSYFLMDNGNYNNNGRTPPPISAVNRYLLGWMTPITLDTPGSYTLPALSGNNQGYLIRISGSGDTGEYFTFETRSTTASIWDQHLGYNGMFVMHIDRRSQYLGLWDSNDLNTYIAPHPLARPVKGNEGSSLGSWVFPGSTNKVTLSETTHNYFKPWVNGTTHDMTLKNISYSGGTVSFNLEIEGVTPPDPIAFSGTVKNASNQNISSGNVTFTRQNTATGANSTTKLTPAGGASFTTTISNGAYSFADLQQEGTYIASITASGYQTHSSVVNVVKNGTAALTVDTAVNSGHTRKSWGGDYNTSVKYTSGGDMIIGARYDYADFGTTGKVIVYGADFHLSSTAGVELQVYKGNSLVKNIAASNLKVGNSNYLDLSSQNISVNSGETIYIAYKLSGYSGSFPAAMSSSTSNLAKGGLIKNSAGANWSQGDANWLIGIHYGAQEATGVTLDKTSIDAFLGDMDTIGYTIVPEGTTAPLSWSSSDSNVVSVDNAGNLKCVGIGTATITVSSTAFSQRATCTVTVAPEINGELRIDVDNFNKKATVNWTPATTRTKWVVRWRPKGGTFDQFETTQNSVTLSPLVWGTEYEITVNGLRSDNRIWGETAGTFKSEQPSATGVELTKTTLAAYMGDMQALEYKILPEGGITTLKWTSSDTSVLAVDDEGVIKPLKAGTATVTVSSNDFSGTATCTVTVSSEIDGNIVIDVNHLEKSAVVSWTPAVARTKWIVRWRVDNGDYTRIETTQPTVSLTALPSGAQGEVLVSGLRSDNEVWGETRATFQITDKPIAERIDLNQTELALFANDKFQLVAAVMPEGAYNSEVEWSTSDSAVVTVDENGLITAIDTGEAVITVKTKIGDVSATCAVTVTMEVAPVEAITVYQNDAEFGWPGSLHEGSFKVEVYAGSTLIVQKTVDTPYVYIPLLNPGTAYEIVVTADRDGGGNSSNLEFTTEARKGKFAHAMINGTYAADEAVPMRIADIQDEVVSIVWKVDGSAVAEADMPAKVLTAGRHELSATITTKSGRKETITKVVKIQ